MYLLSVFFVLTLGLADKQLLSSIFMLNIGSGVGLGVVLRPALCNSSQSCDTVTCLCTVNNDVMLIKGVA